ncbi:hypothetical protein KCH_28010 [Kitasatospora cheerisanensis KCTC 2395]|uniref:Uncharacterized protein n=1 Tax=Kitasatospora cheerisanensis KCTC 2395 TaxID=1348663 RepID=A0A066Z5W4_9ACTN|nr:hypothetical protein KCH_28010 [Kitasatospora cheerisanensis KCTC 2395]
MAAWTVFAEAPLRASLAFTDLRNRPADLPVRPLRFSWIT